MDIKEVIHVYLTRVGMTSQQATKKHLFNIRNSTMFITFGISTCSSVMYLIYGAKTLNEYSDCIYSFISGINTSANFAFITWKMAEIIRSIDHLTDIVNTSEYRSCCHIEMKLVPFFGIIFHGIFYRTHECNFENHLRAKRQKN